MEGRRKLHLEHELGPEWPRESSRGREASRRGVGHLRADQEPDCGACAAATRGVAEVEKSRKELFHAGGAIPETGQPLFHLLQKQATYCSFVNPAFLSAF